MNIKRHILRIVSLSLILSGFNINSYTSSLIEDRYELFNGDKIIIEDNYDISKKGVIINGNTLVNILNVDRVVHEGPYSIVSDDGLIKVVAETEDGKFTGSYGSSKVDYSIDKSKEYSLILNIKKNTLNSSFRFYHYGAFAKFPFNAVEVKSRETGTKVFKLEHSSNEEPTDNSFGYHMLTTGYDANAGIGNTIEYTAMIIEGDWTNKELPKYFKGMKSVGEKSDGSNSIDVINTLTNENLLAGSDFKIVATKDKPANPKRVYVDTEIDMQSLIGKRLTLSFDAHTLGDGKNNENQPIYESDNNISRFGIHLYLEWMNIITNEKVNRYPFVAVQNINKNNERVTLTGTITPPDDNPDDYILLNVSLSVQPYRMPADNNNEEWFISRPKLEYGSEATEWVPNKNDDIYEEYMRSRTTTIKLSEPLRGLPNGISDKIIKKEGQWVVERNLGEVTFNSSDGEGWGENNIINNGVYLVYTKQSPINNISIMSNKLNVDKRIIVPNAGNNIEGIYYNDYYSSFYISILESKLETISLDGFKQWLSENPITVVYQLVTPTYEPLNISSVLTLYEGTNYISNDSIIPSNMEITVDRVCNIAKYYTELAIQNPTIDNVSIARMWNNLVDDSLFKDTYQDKLNNIGVLNDLQIEKKSATVVTDVYIKSKNALSISLDTNSIMFDDFTGVDDKELLKAVNLNVSSSLPYNIGAYLESEIYNEDKSLFIDKEYLNIKESSESDYKMFRSTNEKIILKDNCSAGDSINHSIDLILRGSQMYKADVYRSTIKFEVSQN